MLRRLPRVLAVVLIAVAALDTASAQQSLRRLYVAVTDARGVPVLDLFQHEFDVIENGASVPVERSRLSRDPMRILLLVDSSEVAAGGIIDIRSGLQAFINAVPEEHEIGLMTVGRQMRVRAQPEMDRTRLRRMVEEFAPDGGRTVLLDGLRETDERFMRRLEDGRWPVYIIVTTDGPEGSGSISTDRYVELVSGMLMRGAIAHAVVVQQLDRTVRAELSQMQSMAQQVTPRGGPPRASNSSIPERTPDAGEIALNLTRNLRGSYEAAVTVTSLVGSLRALGQKVVDDHRLMRTRYEIEYRGSRDLAVGAGVRVMRDGLQVVSSPRRPI